MTTAVTSTTGAAQFSRVLSEFKRELSQDEAHDFSFISSTDLKNAILQLQEEQKSKKRMQNLCRLSAFVEAMDQFDKVVHVFLNASNYLGFIWGPAKFMLLIAGSYSEALNTLLDAYQEVGEHMPLLAQYESHISSSPYLQEIVGLIYKDILSFHRKAMKHFRQRAWKKLFNATWRTFRTDFGVIIANLQSHRRLLDSQAIFLGVQEITKVMKELHEARSALDDECKRRQEEDANRRQLAVVSWLSAADSASDHEYALAVHENEPQSGQWLFQQDAVKNWIDPCLSSEPLLWINGRPGAGKTILASNFVEHCRQQSNSDVAYFYCKHGDPSRDNFIGLAQSLTFQFTRLNPSLLPFVLEMQAASGTSSLRSPKIAKEILATCVESFSNLILIIDGLDECIKSQKDEIVSWVRSAATFAETNSLKNLRCCFFSQEDNDTGRLLKGLPLFKITEQHNSEDILRYCRHRANGIGQDFELSVQDVQNLTECVARNADGMFLYAKLVMDNLAGQVSKAALYTEMGTIPPDLNQVYRRIRHRILDESSPPVRQAAKTLLSWLLCAKRPLKWHEIQGAMSLNLENDSFDAERRLIKDIKHFCGSLIEIRRGGAICFVHLTAKYFLQDEPALSTQLEHISLTRLCFSQLSLASHASDVSQESIRRYIIRGEYAFTEYSIIYSFDHLFDVLSEMGEVSSDYGALCISLRKFVTKRVNAPTGKASTNKYMNDKLQVFKNEKFYNSLKHAIIYHRDSLENSAKDTEEEPILALLQQFARVRSVLERIATSGPTSGLDTLYGDNLFKCAELRCESFYDGFATQRIRDKHCKQHERIYLCSVPGCASSMVGFSSYIALQKHKQDYHNGDPAGISFPWHGELDNLNISEEIKKGNYSAFELWLSQWEDSVPLSTAPLYETALYGHNKMLEVLLGKIKSESIDGAIRWAVYGAIRSDNEEGVRIILGHFKKFDYNEAYRLVTKAFRLGMDEIAKEILKHPSSPVINPKRPRKELYLNLAIRFGRYAVFQHILKTYGADPNREDEKGRTSLIAAAEFDRIEIAKYLIETEGCEKLTGNKRGITPLSMAGRQGHEEFISSIYHEEISVKGVQEWLKTAQLRNAARDGDDRKVRELLDEGLAHRDEVDTQTRSPWLWAVERNHDCVVQVFLSKTGINFHRRLIAGYSNSRRNNAPGVIHLVALSGNDSLMRMLLQSGKFDDEVTKSCTTFGKGPRGVGVSGSPIDIARDCRHKNVVNIIKDYKATLGNDEELIESISGVLEPQ